MRNSRLFVVALVVGLGLVRAQAQEQWIEIKSPHFSVLTDAGEDTGREISTYFEQMRDAFTWLLPVNSGAVRSPVVQIIAFWDKRHINDFGLLLDTDAPQARLVLDGGDVQEDREKQGLGVDGRLTETPLRVKEVYLQNTDQDYILLNLRVKRDWTTIFHQYAHVLLENNYPPLPRWFVEGFAEYYASVKIQKKTALIGGRPQLAGSVLGHREWVPVSTLFSSDSGAEADSRYSPFYAESWLMFDYLFKNKKIADALAYCELVRQGVTIPEAIQQAFHMSAAQLDQELHQSVQTSGARVTLPLSPLQMNVSVSSVPELTLKTTFADAHLHDPGYRRQAVQEFTEILRNNPDNPEAHRGLAQSALRNHDYPAAIAELKKAAEKSPDDWKAHYYWAQALRLQENPALAPELEREARLVIRLNPDFAQGYGLLGSALASQGKNADAATAFETAVRLCPAQDVFSINLAMVYFAQDKYQQAKPIFSQLQNSKNHKYADAARAYLRSIAKLEEKSVRN